MKIVTFVLSLLVYVAAFSASSPFPPWLKNVEQKDLKYDSNSGISSTYIAKAQYDFAIQGGAISQICSGVYIPDDAIVIGAFSEEVTNFTSTAGGTMSIDLESEADIFADTAVASWSGIQEGVPKVETSSTFIKLTARRQLCVEIESSPMTAGKLNYWIQYILGN